MKYSDFEKQMGERLRSHKVDLDTGALYKSIKNQQKRRRNGAIIYFLPAIMLGLIIYGFGYLNMFNTKDILPIQTLSDVNLDTKNSLAKAQFVNQESQEVIIKHAQVKENILSDPSSYNIKNNTGTQSKTKAYIQDIHNKNNKKQANSFSDQAPESDFNNLNTDLALTGKVSDNSTSEQNSAYVVNDNESVTIHLGSENESAPEMYLHQIDKLSTLFPGSLSNDYFFNLDTDIKCPDFRINKSRLNIEILADAGYFVPIKKFQNNSVEVNEVNQLRIAHEKSREGYHAGIYAKFSNAKWPVYIQAGISQDHITERMTLEYNYTRMDTTQGIISITTSENGDTITAIIGDIITETEVSGKKVKHYRLQTIDVPVTIGYSLPLNRFTLDIEGGVLFNLGVNNRGSILSDQNNFDDVGTMNPFKSKVGVSYLGGISLGYHLTQRSKLYLNTKLRIIPDEFNRPDNSLSQKYKLTGVNIGYGYTF